MIKLLRIDFSTEKGHMPEGFPEGIDNEGTSPQKSKKGDEKK